jgi:hypothetical protein
MKISIFQSNYIPWKGYFDLIEYVDVFYFLDNVQFSKNTFRNRNMIQNTKSKFYLTVPVNKGKLNDKISEKLIIENNWQQKHWKSIEQCYSKSKNFKNISKILKPYYLDLKFKTLSELNQKLIITICDYLRIKTKIITHDEIKYKANDRNMRLIEITKFLNCKTYVSSPQAKNYVNKILFNQEKINLEWFQYSKKLNQISIIDFLFNN